MTYLQNGVHIVVGTPGRVLDLVQRGALDASNILLFILGMIANSYIIVTSLICVDEADEMLSRGFKDQIYDVFQVLPQNVQVGLFSATMPVEALEITQKFMNNPLRILVRQEEITLEGILHSSTFSRVWLT